MDPQTRDKKKVRDRETLFDFETGATILLVEDDPGHARLIQKYLRRSAFANKVECFQTGEAFLEYIRRTCEHRAAPSSIRHVVLLDLNLPGIDGYEVLKRLKGDRRTKHIPVIVLTTSSEKQDVEKCYKLGCNVFIPKPLGYEQFSYIVSKLGLVLSLAELPRGGGKNG